MLRRILLVFGGLCVLAALTLGFLFGGVLSWYAAFELGVFGALLIVSLIWEGRYRARVDRNRGEWQDTGERNIDPTSGQLIAVYFNPSTGERDYRGVVPPG